MQNNDTIEISLFFTDRERSEAEDFTGAAKGCLDHSKNSTVLSHAQLCINQQGKMEGKEGSKAIDQICPPTPGQSHGTKDFFNERILERMNICSYLGNPV